MDLARGIGRPPPRDHDRIWVRGRRLAGHAERSARQKVAAPQFRPLTAQTAFANHGSRSMSSAQRSGSAASGAGPKPFAPIVRCNRLFGRPLVLLQKLLNC